MKFFYREIEVLHSPASQRKRKIFRPIITLFVVYGKNIIGYEALIDSGADYNIFDGAVAQYLGIKITSGYKRQITGLGGKSIIGYEHKVILRIGEAQFGTQAIFSKEIPADSFGVLGNQGFFDHFKATLDYRKRTIVLA